MAITWIKLQISMFDNQKIRLIEKMPAGDTVLIIWIKLLTYAGKSNANGYIMLTDTIPLKSDQLATLFDRPIETVKMALITLEKFGMINLDDNEAIQITNWDKYQNVDRLEMAKEQNRLRQQRFRKRQRLKALPSGKEEEVLTPEKTAASSNDEHSGNGVLNKGNVRRNVTNDAGIPLGVTLSHAADIDLEKELEKDQKISRQRNTKIAYSEKQMALAQQLLKNIKLVIPNFREPNLERWANEIRLMVEGRREKRSADEILTVIQWVAGDDFWRTVIQSPASLRKNFDKLLAQMQFKKKKQSGVRKDKNACIKEWLKHESGGGGDPL
ncbi:phage replisome organizer N-terminal domain-containing protein [Sporolactobacillus sp. KGMB 08714]|uniref:phage replisome organizer N-terminal domain-containing protein n=1 Tax=Sporolactobacillus sp. KGMB 08714 TaxID=3064704 RepID=UPI002FBE0023